MMRITWPIEVSADGDFPLTNIPFGIFSTREKASKRAGTAIGDLILDLSILSHNGYFAAILEAEKSNDLSLETRSSMFSQESLNTFAALRAETRTAIRNKIISLLDNPQSDLFTNNSLNEDAFVEQSEAKMHLPIAIGDFTDFMCARVHGENCSRMSGYSLNPSFFAFPTAYNGRSSSVMVSGTPITRPHGMFRRPDSQDFTFGPSMRMDYELEMGFFVSKPVPFGEIISSADEAREHIFGFVLLNDWSARDIQSAEMNPLGPFNGKGSGTTISPWIVTLDALQGARASSNDIKVSDAMNARPNHLRHLDEKYTWDIGVSASVKRNNWNEPAEISNSNLKDLYWSPAQMLTHHASSGCGLRTGDLMGTGTISGESTTSEGSRPLGCLREVTEAGKNAFVLKNGERITWIEDGDEIIMRGKVKQTDGSTIGFGNCKGVLVSASKLR